MNGFLARCVAVIVSGASIVTLGVAGTPPAEAQGQACSISWDGSLGATNNWTAISANGPGPEDDITNWSPERIPNATDHACLPNGSVARIENEVVTTDSYAIAAGATLNLVGTGTGSNTLQAEANSTNAGVINFLGSGGSGITHADNDSAPDSEGLLNTGTINFTDHPGGSGIFGSLTNQGLLNVDDADATIQRVEVGGEPAVVQHVNQGTIDISPGNALRVLHSAAFTHGQGSVITGGGTLNFSSGEMDVSGDATIAPGTDVNFGGSSTLDGTAGSGATGNIDFVVSSVDQFIKGTVPAGITIDIDGTFVATTPSTPGATTTNAGTININGTNASLLATPDDPANPTTKLTNTGTIALTNADDGFNNLLGDVLNQGTIRADHPKASFSRNQTGGNPPAQLTNQGTIRMPDANDALRICCGVRAFVHGPGSVIAGSGAINMSEGRFEVSGDAQVQAPADVNLSGNARLIGVAGAATGNVDFVGGGCCNLTIEGTVPSGMVLDIDGGAFVTTGTADVTNAGRININGANSTLHKLHDNVDNPTTDLINTGTIEFTSTGTGLRTMRGEFINLGTILVNHPEASFQSVGAGGHPGTVNLQNGGTVAISSGNALRVCCGGVFTQTAGTLSIADGGAFNGSATLNGGRVEGDGAVTGSLQNNAGTVAPGSSPGILTVNGNYTQGAEGALAIEVQGASPGSGHDQLLVGGSAALDGTLRIDTSGFTPAPGAEFKVLQAATVSGSFAQTQPSGAAYDVVAGPGEITLRALASPPALDGDGDGVPDASDECPSQAGPAANNGCPVVDPPPADADSDGVPDSGDSCPSQAGPAANKGCPVVDPPPPDTGCEAAQDKLEKAKAKLKKLKQKDAARKKVRKAKKKVKQAKQTAAAACG